MKFLKLQILFISSIMLSAGASAQLMVDLYPGEVPNSKGIASRDTEIEATEGLFSNVSYPTLELFLPEKSDSLRTAVIICPGGGYGVVVYNAEGITTAKAFAEKGIAAFVLKYRLPDTTIMQDKTIGPLQDVQQAIKLVRENAPEWNIDTNNVGIMGFSAGGHLAASGATRCRESLIRNPEKTNLRPDFQVLVYPVISMHDSLTHMGSRINLLGEDPGKEILDLFSAELQTDTNTPPAYITHAADDNLVDVDNSILYFEALRKNKVDVEMHIFRKGDHGFIFRREGWMDPLFKWMEDSEIIK